VCEGERVCVCDTETGREIVYACAREREKERERENVCVRVCVCACVCVRALERENVRVCEFVRAYVWALSKRA